MWLTPKQARLVTGLERYQLDWLRKSGQISARKWQNMWLYDAGELYRINDRARRVLDELADFCERTESGRHFTEAFSYWQVLEECGWIQVYRPVHPATKLQYDMQYFSAQLTEEGEELANSISELRAELAADDVVRLHHISGRVRLARLTTRHSASSYGQPVLVDISTGEAINGRELAEYRVEASEDQLKELSRNPGYAEYVWVM
jgi:hypothetical protein